MLRALLASTLLAACSTLPAVAQEARPATHVYEALFRISFADLDEWNRQYREYAIPILEDMQAAGEIEGWGQWEHHTGSPYNIRFTVRTFDWPAIDAFWREYLQRLGQAAELDGARPAAEMIQAHQDNVWNLAYANVPAEGEAAYLYESTFRVGFGDEDAWNSVWEGPARALVEESAAAGGVDGWVKLDHNTGGPLNSKLLFFFEDWDEIDDFWAFFLAELPARYPDQAGQAFSVIREHDDVIWVPTPAADPM